LWKDVGGIPKGWKIQDFPSPTKALNDMSTNPDFPRDSRYVASWKKAGPCIELAGTFT
jgi:hypothetical protein